MSSEPNGGQAAPEQAEQFWSSAQEVEQANSAHAARQASGGRDAAGPAGVGASGGVASGGVGAGVVDGGVGSQSRGGASSSSGVTGSSGPAGNSAAANPGGNNGLRMILHVAAALLVILGISLPVDGSGVMWSNSAAWAALATVAALAQGLALMGAKELGGRSWMIAAIAAGALVLIWTLIMLPSISTNQAFMFTMGTACAVGGVLLSPSRPDLR